MIRRRHLALRRLFFVKRRQGRAKTLTPPFDLINTTAWIIRWSAGPVHYVYIGLLESVNLSKAYKLGYLVHIPLALEGSERRNGFVEAF